MKKQSLNTSKSLNKNFEPQFCTECDEQLEHFFLDPIAVDRNAVKDHFKHCKASGKFKGEICSKLFISSDDFEEQSNED
jgi:hypothetical protein